MSRHLSQKLSKNEHSETHGVGQWDFCSCEIDFRGKLSLELRVGGESSWCHRPECHVILDTSLKTWGSCLQRQKVSAERKGQVEPLKEQSCLNADQPAFIFLEGLYFVSSSRIPVDLLFLRWSPPCMWVNLSDFYSRKVLPRTMMGPNWQWGKPEVLTANWGHVPIQDVQPVTFLCWAWGSRTGASTLRFPSREGHMWILCLLSTQHWKNGFRNSEMNCATNSPC
jgi:hypothetical protein